MEINKVWYTLVFFGILMATMVYSEPQYNKLDTESAARPVDVNYSLVNVNNSDYLDGYDSSAFAKLNEDNTFTNNNDFNGLFAGAFNYGQRLNESGLYGYDESYNYYNLISYKYIDGQINLGDNNIAMYLLSNLNTDKLISSTSNITATYFKGNGSQLTGVCLQNGSNCPTSGTYNISYHGSLNNGSYLTTFNSSYDAKISDNSTWNETRANLLYFKVNQTNPQGIILTGNKVINISGGTETHPDYGANSPTQQIISNGRKLILGNTGDYYGGSTLEIGARTGLTGALFRTTGIDVLDFAFQSQSGDSNQMNFRWENRYSTATDNGGTKEFQMMIDPLQPLGGGTGVAPMIAGGKVVSFFGASNTIFTNPSTGKVGINVLNPKTALEVSPDTSTGTTTEYPSSSYFTTSYIVITTSSVTGYINGYGDTFYDGGDGFLYRGSDNVQIGTINYNTGVVDTQSNPDTVDEITYSYDSSIIAGKFNGNIQINHDSSTGTPLKININGATDTAYNTGFIINEQYGSGQVSQGWSINDVLVGYLRADSSTNFVFNSEGAGAIYFRNNAEANTMLVLDSANNVADLNLPIRTTTTGNQLTLRYDTNNYLRTNVSSTGIVRFDAVGTTPEFNFFDNVNIQSKTLFVGNTTSNVTIDNVNGLRMSGTATTYNDVVAPLTIAHVGATAPVFDENQKAYKFEDGASEEYSFVSLQIPHSYKAGSNIYCHLHVRPDGTQKNNVTFEMNYSWYSLGQTSLTTTGAITVSQNFTSGVAYNNTIIDFGGITGTGKTESSTVAVKLTRKSNVASDTYTGDVFVDFFDCHHEMEKLGTNNEYT